MILQFYFSSVQSFSILCQALTRSVKHFCSPVFCQKHFYEYSRRMETENTRGGIKVLRGRWRYRCILSVMWKRSSSVALMEAVVNELMLGWCQFGLDDSEARTPCAKHRIYSLHIFMITTALAMILRHSSRLDINCAERYRFLPLKKYLLCRLQPPTHSSKLWFPQKAQDCVYFSFSNSFFILIVALARKCFRKMFKLWKDRIRESGEINQKAALTNTTKPSFYYSLVRESFQIVFKTWITRKTNNRAEVSSQKIDEFNGKAR